MNVKFEQTSLGEVAIMPRADYERLRTLANEAEEDTGTARIVARAKKDVAEGSPTIPFAVVKRLETEHPVRVLRQWLEMTQQVLAASVGITQNYLSEIENGKRNGPFELHQKIARSLGVPFEMLAPIAVPREKSDPQRHTRRKAVVTEMKRSRTRR